MLQDKIKGEITDFLKQYYDINDPVFDVLPTNNLKDGDLYTNVALKYSKITGLLPMQLAKDLSKELTSDNYDISVVKPGFINFSLSEHYLLENIDTFSNTLKGGNNEMVVIEYMQPNTNKPLHIGHLRNAALGGSLSNILESYGYNVKRATVNNDRGLHITKSMWGYLMLGCKKAAVGKDSDWIGTLHAWSDGADNWLSPEDMENPRLRKPDHFVGQYYVLADKYAGNDKKVEKDWEDMLSVWEDPSHKVHTKVKELWNYVNSYFYKGYKESADVLGVRFNKDFISYESEVYQAGKEIILEGVKRGVFNTVKGGAVEASLEKYHLPNKILIRSNGTGIYMTFDVELTRQRKQIGAKHLIWVVGSDQDLYFRQLFAVVNLLGYGEPEDFTHYSYGMVSLPEGKMSSRKGNVVYADDLLKKVEDGVRVTMEESKLGKDLDPVAAARVTKDVALGAIKWSMLSVEANKNIIFSIKQTVSFKGFSGPYIQYTHARCSSVLEKKGIEVSQALDLSDLDLFSAEEKDIVRLLFRFNIEVARAANELAPHYICHYLYDLCQEYNSFYAKHKILGSNNENTRLAITSEVMLVIKTGLSLLGIKSPKSM